MLTVQTILQIILGGGGIAALIGLFKLRSDKRKLEAETQKLKSESHKSDADAVSVFTSSAISLFQPQTDQVKAMQSRLQEANSEIDKLHNKLRLFREEADREIEALRTKLNEAIRRADESENKYNDLAHEHELMRRRMEGVQ